MGTRVEKEFNNSILIIVNMTNFSNFSSAQLLVVTENLIDVYIK